MIGAQDDDFAGSVLKDPCHVIRAESGAVLRCCGDRGDRKPDNPEQVIDALLLEAPRDQGSAVDFAHALLLVTDFSREITH